MQRIRNRDIRERVKDRNSLLERSDQSVEEVDGARRSERPKKKRIKGVRNLELSENGKVS